VKNEEVCFRSFYFAVLSSIVQMFDCSKLDWTVRVKLIMWLINIHQYLCTLLRKTDKYFAPTGLEPWRGANARGFTSSYQYVAPTELFNLPAGQAGHDPPAP